MRRKDRGRVGPGEVRGSAAGTALVAGRGATGALLALVLVLAPRAAEACAVCFGGGQDDWTGGFVLGTIMMLALPPAIVVGAGFAIWRSIKRQEAEDAGGRGGEVRRSSEP